MEDERSSSPSSVASSYEETDSKSSNLYQPILNPFWYTYASILNSIRPTTPIVRHNFKNIDELISSTPSQKNGNSIIDDTGYNSQLSVSLQSQETDDDMENLKPPIPSTPLIKKTKNVRTAFTDDQKYYLDRFYSLNRYPDSTEMETLSHLLSLNEKVIRVWFQNKRSREKIQPRNHLIMNTSSTNFLH